MYACLCHWVHSLYRKIRAYILIQSLVGLLLGLEGGLAGLSLIIVFFLSSLFLLKVAVL